MVFTVMSSLTCGNRDRRHLSADAARRRLRPWRSVGSRAAPTEGRRKDVREEALAMAMYWLIISLDCMKSLTDEILSLSLTVR